MKERGVNDGCKGDDSSYFPLEQNNNVLTNNMDKAIFIENSNTDTSNSNLPNLRYSSEHILEEILAVEKEVSHLITSFKENKATGHFFIFLKFIFY